MPFNLDAVLASTLPYIEKKFQNNLATKTPLMLKFKEQGGMYMVGGGTVLKFPVILAKGNAGSYYGDDVLNVNRPAGIQALEFDWRQFYSSVVIIGIEEIQNAGEEQAADLLDGRMKQAEITTIENFETMLFGDGTGNVGGDGTARDWTGLQQLIADDPTTGNVGKLNRATFTQLQNQRFTTAITAFNTSQNGRNGMTRLWADCTQGNRVPNLALTTTAIWVLYQLSLTTNERFLVNQDKGLTDAGFPNVAFMNMPVAISAGCIASHLYMLRINKPMSDGGIFLVVSKQRNFKMMPFITPRDQDVRSSLVLTAGELATDAPYLSGVMTNITG